MPAVAVLLAVRAMDTDKDGAVSREEMRLGFARWFEAWGGDKGPLTEAQIRDGAGKDLVAMPGGFGPGPGR